MGWHLADFAIFGSMWCKKKNARRDRSNFNSLCQRGGWLRRANGGRRAPRTAAALRPVLAGIRAMNGTLSLEVAQVATMGAHAVVWLPGGLTDPCHGVGVPKYRKLWVVHMARKTPYLGGNPGKRPKSRNFAPLDSRALKAP